jgi:hypothetical protein
MIFPIFASPVAGITAWANKPSPSVNFWWLQLYSDAKLPLKFWGGKQKLGERGRKALKWNKAEISGLNHVSNR